MRNAESVERGLLGASALAAGIATGMILPEALAVGGAAVRGVLAYPTVRAVITGPAFLGADLRKVGTVLVPSHLSKVVSSPRQRAGAAYFVENKADVMYVTMSVAQLEAKIGINLLPSLSARQKETMLRLPSPKIRHR